MVVIDTIQVEFVFLSNKNKISSERIVLGEMYMLVYHRELPEAHCGSLTSDYHHDEDLDGDSNSDSRLSSLSWRPGGLGGGGRDRLRDSGSARKHLFAILP